MQDYVIPNMYSNIFWDLLNQSLTCILKGRRISDWFKNKSSAKQGCEEDSV